MNVLLKKKVLFLILILLFNCRRDEGNTEGFTWAGRLELSPQEKFWLAEHPVIRMGHSSEFEPFLISSENGEVSGIIVDFFKLIEQRLGIKVEWVNDRWGTILSMAKEKKIDGVGILAGVAAKQAGLLETRPHIKSYAAFYGKTGGNVKINTLDDLKGLRVAYFKEVVFLSNYFEGHKEELEAIEAESFLQAVNLVMEGKADLAAGLSSDNYSLVKNNITAISPLFVSEMMGQDVFSGIRGDWPEFAAIMNKAIDSIPSEELEAILNKWNYPRMAPGLPVISLSASEKRWLKDHPVIDMWSSSDLEPYVIQSESGELKGLFVELIKILEDRIGIKINLRNGKWPEVLRRAKAGEIDGIPGLTPVAAKQAGLLQSSAHIQFFMTFYGMRGLSPRINGLEDLKGLKVAYDSKFVFLEDFFTPREKEMTLLRTENFVEAVKLVQQGKADIAAGMSSDYYYLSKYFVPGIDPFWIDEKTYIKLVTGIRPGWPELVSIINKALETVTPVEFERIYKTWGTIPEVEIAPNISLTPREAAWLNKHLVIRLGFTSHFEPFMIKTESGELRGIFVDLFKIIEQRLGIPIEIADDTWNEVVRKAREGELHGVAGITSSTADLSGLLKTGTHITNFSTFFGLSESNPPLKNLEDLKGLKVAYDENLTFYNTLFKSYEKDTEFIKTKNFLEAVKMVQEGKADLAAGVSTDSYYLARYFHPGIKPLLVTDEISIEAVTGIHSEHPELVSILDKVLDTITLNEYKNIYNKWGVTEVGEDKPFYISFTPEEAAWLAEHPVIRVGTDPNWAPIEFKDKNGEFQGISVEYLTLLEDMIGIRFEIDKDSSWSELISKAKRKDLDLFSSLAVTPERSEYLSFTKPYVTFPAVIFTLDEVTYVGSLEELNNKKAAVVKGYAVHEWVARDFPGIELVLCNDIKEGLDKLQKGEVFAFIGNIITTGYYIKEKGYINIKIAGDTPYMYSQTMAVRNDWPLLTNILQKALDSIPATEHNGIYQKWIALKYEHGFDYELFIRIIAVIFIIFLGIFIPFFYWNRRLSKEVIERRRVENLLRLREKDLILSREKAETANRAKSEFLANMSHEIRTPMNSILGFTEILSYTYNDEKQKEYLRAIRAGGKSLLTLINDILDLSKVEAGKLKLEYKAVNPHTIFHEMKLIFKQKMEEKGLDFFVEIDPELPSCLILDEIRLRQVLLNLIGNAVKFTETGYVKVSVRLNYTDKEHNRLELIFSVEDTGIGIPEDQIEAIFGAFEQSRRFGRYGGTGLGLTITRRLVEMMGGKIFAASREGGGSAFNIILEEIEVASILAESEESEIQTDKIRFEHASILLVDDIDPNRNLIMGFLESFDFNFYEAENGLEAVKLAKRFYPNLILMDIKMPVMDGFEATKRIKADEATKGIPVIALTASGMMEDAQKIEKVCDGHLKKPVSRSELIAELTRFFKYTIEEVQDEPSVRNTEPFIPEGETLEKLPELLAHLQSELKVWETLQKTMIIQEIQSFAGRMEVLGYRYGYLPLEQWAEKLRLRAELFDIAGLTGILSDFPDLINRIQSFVTDDKKKGGNDG